MILETIIREKRRIISAEEKVLPRAELTGKKRLRKTTSLKHNILKHGFGLIAEIKRASPSAGVIRKNLDVRETALAYREMHVSGISVLTCEPFFNGKMDDMKTVREAVRLPLLMKDFIIDPRQIYRGRIYGADAILLILRILSDENLLSLIDTAEKLAMEVVLEIHTRGELERALRLVNNWDNKILGINNRDLDTLRTDLKTTLNLIKFVPEDKIVTISESGIRSRRDIERLREAGVKGALVGEFLLKGTDVREKLKELM